MTKRASRPGGIAISPAIGPLPAIYVHVPAPTGGTMSGIPVDLRYSQDHLWVRPDPGGGLVRVGVTDFAQRSLGDVVQVTLPGLGETIKAGQACGDIESVKSVNDLVAPVAGTVRARNDNLASTPELVNTDIEAARCELAGSGVKAGAIRHKSPVGDWKGGWQPGTDPERRDYASFAEFADPDGNTWVLQEIGYTADGGSPV
jgi:glycine cleavage system H protein